MNPYSKHWKSMYYSTETLAQTFVDGVSGFESKNLEVADHLTIYRRIRSSSEWLSIKIYIARMISSLLEMLEKLYCWLLYFAKML